MKKKRVLVVGAFANESESKIKGGVRRVCSILQTSQYFEVFDVKTLDSTQKSYPAPPIIVRFFYSIIRIFQLIGTISRFKPNMVLLFCSNGLSFYEKSLMVIVAKCLGSKSVLFPRGSGRFLKQSWLNSFNGMLLRQADLVLCQGEAVKKFFQSSYGVLGSKLAVLENWTATEEILEVGRKREYLKEDVLKILFVGWLEPAKGTKNIIDVVKHLHKSSLNYEFNIVGDGSEKEELIKNLEVQVLQGNVIFHSWIDQNKLINIYSNCHIFFLPSWREGLPNSLIEAMAAGLAPVTTPVGNIPSVIESNINGFLCPVNDSKSMIKKITLLLKNSNLLHKISITAKNSAKKRFSTKENINKLIAVTDKVISGYD